MRRPSPSPPPARGPALAAAAAVVVLLPSIFPSIFTPLGRAFPSLFSEWNAPKPMHESLLNEALRRTISNEQKRELWSPLRYQGWKPCLKSSSVHGVPLEPTGYIQVFLDGGLNQQRMGICDAVAVAKVLNATLVIPHLEVNPVWKDTSSFEEIFDVDHFINTLKAEVSIVKVLPKEFSWSTREYYGTGIRATRIKTAPVHASASWYLENVSPILQSYGIAAIAPFSHRLAFDDLPADIQHLRCKGHSGELIQEVGEDTNQAGKYAVLHLRFDKDMAAHSACDFGGGRAERLALAKYRQVIWQGRVLNSQLTDEELRNMGRCPLTPEEIGLLLTALGFDSRTRIYLASHKVYGGEARISSLRKLFPLMVDKRSLASEEELANVEGKASVLAALDYYISMHSDIFISASPGNMHNALMAHRTFENMKTIRPNMALLGRIFVNKSMEWLEFQEAVQAGHKGRYGQIRLRKPKQSIYTYPAPDCMCQG
uniref:O-fucosyltransferase family protein n=1 Tax=Oryza punctata TaxID=4537 RepID=A0A0E0M147_ORYPU